MAPMSDIKRLSRILKALANENRLQLYLAIREAHTLTVAPPTCFAYALAADLGIGAPTVSHHLKELERADLIVTRRVGKQVAADINPETVQLVRQLL